MPPRKERARRIKQLESGLLVGFLAVAASLAFWNIVWGRALSSRNDNPRVVEEELRIRRGRILDDNGEVVAETVGPADDLKRFYPLATIGPAVGYYSFRHGTAGAENSFDSVLRGDSERFWKSFWRTNLHQDQEGRDIRLTLNANWQRAADALMGANQGALVLLSLPDVAVRSLVSHPGYDPNQLDAQFESLTADSRAPLLNRATQGQYQPGPIVQPFVAAAGIDAELIDPRATVTGANRPVIVRGQVRQCLTPPGTEVTWADALAHACPFPFFSLASSVASSDVNAIFADFGFTQPPPIPLETTSSQEPVSAEVGAALIGQSDLTVTPLQVGLAWTAIGTGGILQGPLLVASVQSENGDWRTVDSPERGERRIISQPAAETILLALPRHRGFISEYSTQALAGPEGETNVWYLGLAPAEEPRLAVVVVVEDSQRVEDAQRIGRSLLTHILAPAK